MTTPHPRVDGWLKHDRRRTVSRDDLADCGYIVVDRDELHQITDDLDERFGDTVWLGDDTHRRDITDRLRHLLDEQPDT